MDEWTEAHQRLYESNLTDRDLAKWARSNGSPQPDPVEQLRVTKPAQYQHLRTQAERQVAAGERVAEQLADERERAADEIWLAKTYAEDIRQMANGRGRR